ncbi:CidA/LrgA family protein [Deefgea salmonis]|uniref:CidA/LrgA family protein n=1 Tax=Deefgea salmonis TaxID=2875502 RepID=A0ABS8BHF9_9NEIS|nr:CidA/LrgA family protein [Deefgea salmonis]MCB5195139.1 CidA/LrgA family protein [Deefgea salmonis]
MLYGLSIVFLALVSGEFLRQLFHLPIPAVVIGMLLLTAWCIVRGGVESRVAYASEGLLRYLGILFVPAGVGLIELGDKLKSQGIAMLVTILISTLVTLLVTGVVLQFLLLRRKEKLNQRAEK